MNAGMVGLDVGTIVGCVLVLVANWWSYRRQVEILDVQRRINVMLLEQAEHIAVLKRWFDSLGHLIESDDHV
jgi:hypothetical protein